MHSSPLHFESRGPADGPVLFFIHGWPDSASLWQSQIAHFEKTYRCVSVTLPGFGQGKSAYFGLDFPALVEALAQTIRQVTASKPGSRVVLVGHDWGAFLVYLVERQHPELVDRMVTLDVGAHLVPSTLGHALFLLAYQGWLVAAFFIGRVVPVVGNAMSRAFARLANAPDPGSVHSGMNYLYYYFWRARFLKKYRSALPLRYRPHRPMLYLYGKRKRYAFHSPKWEAIVVTTPGSRCVAIDGGHWFGFRKPGPTNQAMQEWLLEP